MGVSVRLRLKIAFFFVKLNIRGVLRCKKVAILTVKTYFPEFSEFSLLHFFILKYVSLTLRKLWNIFDLVVIGAAFLISIAEEIRGDKFDSGLILDVMLVLR